MNLNLNINNYGGKSVVPITCNGHQGTAFYIGKDYLLTAYHVVSDAYFDSSAVVAIINGKECPCKFIKLGDLDVALLKSFTPIDENLIEKIPLLSTSFKEGLELQIIGYPQEIGNGIDYFSICVRNIRELGHHDRGFDVVVQRTDPFGFYSYSGFSGSPVLNEFGYAIGIVTDQLYKSLGYTSIHSITQALNEKGIFLYDNEDALDTRPYGLGSCIKFAEKALLKVQRRYQSDRHVKDEKLEEIISIFCQLDLNKRKESLHKCFQTWYNGLPNEYKRCCEKYPAFMDYIKNSNISEKIHYDLEGIALEQDHHYKEYTLLKGKYMTDFQHIIDKFQEFLEVDRIAKKKFLYINGDAGNGKTHNLCDIVKRLCEKTYIYLFFGHEFNATDSPIDSIGSILEWGDKNYLKALNDEMTARRKYAVFVIDALNEGEGTYMWKEKLPQLQGEIGKYDRLKLIVTVRTMEPNDELIKVFKKSDWEQYTVEGFMDSRKAIEKYFSIYGINEKPENYLNYREFKKPLFLKIFCESFYSLSYEQRMDINILQLYDLYFKKRNNEVSKMVDEDPRKQITNKLLYRLGERSLLSFECSDIPRDTAIKVANKICRNRQWSENLYHSAIKSNLLMEYFSPYGQDYTMFEYDSMGDFVRATSLMNLNRNDNERFAHILRLVKLFNDKDTLPKSKKHIIHTLKAFLSVWNPDASFWKKKEFSVGILKRVLIESLSYRNIYSKQSTLTADIINDIFKDDDSLYDVKNVFNEFTLYKTVLIKYLHDGLMKMSMKERDEKWTIGVNQLYDSYTLSYTLNNVHLNNEDDWFTYLHILCWMMSASHPNERIRIIRKVVFYLSERKECCLKLIDLFHCVNDPYVLSGVYSAIYGLLLRTYDKALTHKVAEKIFTWHYKDQKDVPSELMSRVWSLKILEYDKYLNSNENFWELSQPSYRVKENLLVSSAVDDFMNNDYFGTGGGSHRLYRSLFEWDFNWYIIGSNSTNDSPTFIKDGKPVKLTDITNAVAYRIKNTYGYSDVLSNYDETVAWDDNTYHRVERIGKKYQWIALGEVYAFLCDTCKVKKNEFYDELADVPYPWYCDRMSYLDPTILETDNHLIIDNEMFETLDMENLFEKDRKDWVESREDMPKIQILLRDKSGEEWLVVIGYQKNKQEGSNERRESFIYYSPCLVPMDEGLSEKFAQWAKDQNFYGRWMPEFTGSYEYIWNEAPWCDQYKQLSSNEVEIWRNNAPCKVILPYNAQFQEERIAVDDEDSFNSTVYMPIGEMYDMFHLHNAERGVIRDYEGQVIAINRNIPGDSLDALVIRKKYLDQYLKEKNYSLFFCNLAEKQVWEGANLVNMQRISNCCQYDPESGLIVVQPMKDERDFPEPKTGSVSDIYGDEIDIANWLKAEKTDCQTADFLNQQLSSLNNETKKNENDN